MARTALAIAGAGIGYWIKASTGAQWGFMAGSVAGALLFSDNINIPGPKLGDPPVQTGRDGIPIPIGWGVVPVSGNIIQTTPIVEVTTTEKVGKGGGTTTETTRRFRTFAIGVARSSVGPIDGISRIWEFDKLVYDTRNSPAIDAAETQKFADGLNIYLGDSSQLPDAELEANTGVGLTPAYRGLPYVVFVNKDITDFGSAIPQYRFELNTGSDLTVTSRPYPIEIIEGFDSGFALSKVRRYWHDPEGFDAGFAVTGISIGATLHTHTIAPEGFDPTFAISGITNDDRLRDHSIAPEGFDPTFAVTSIVIDPRLVAHNYAAEGFDPTFAVTGIALT